MDGSFAFFLLICGLFGVAGGLQGRSKGSSFLLWFFISACLPVFGFIAAVVYPGHRSELRRQCDGCGRLLPITDTMCMSCGTDLDFPEVRYLPADVRPPATAAGRPVGAGEKPDAGEEPDADDDSDADDGSHANAESHANAADLGSDADRADSHPVGAPDASAVGGPSPAGVAAAGRPAAPTDQ